MNGEPWLPEQVAILIDKYPTCLKVEDLLEGVGHTLRSTYTKAGALGLKREVNDGHKNLKGGETTRFKKGQTPHNKGTKGLMKANSGSFKKGQVPKTTKFFGAPYLVKRKRRRGKEGFELFWALQELGTNKRVVYTRKLWKDTYGDIPPNHVVVFKHGVVVDRVPTLEDLELITRRENLNRNSGIFDVTEKYIKDKLRRRGIEEASPALVDMLKNTIKVDRLIKEIENEKSTKID